MNVQTLTGTALFLGFTIFLLLVPAALGVKSMYNTYRTPKTLQSRGYFRAQIAVWLLADLLIMSVTYFIPGQEALALLLFPGFIAPLMYIKFMPTRTYSAQAK